MSLSKKTDERLTTIAIVLGVIMLSGYIVLMGLDTIGHLGRFQ